MSETVKTTAPFAATVRAIIDGDDNEQKLVSFEGRSLVYVLPHELETVMRAAEADHRQIIITTTRDAIATAELGPKQEAEISLFGKFMQAATTFIRVTPPQTPSTVKATAPRYDR